MLIIITIILGIPLECVAVGNKNKRCEGGFEKMTKQSITVITIFYIFYFLYKYFFFCFFQNYLI